MMDPGLGLELEIRKISINEESVVKFFCYRKEGGIII